MERTSCSGCSGICSLNFPVKDMDGMHYYCGSSDHCRRALQKHEILASRRRLDAGLSCSFMIPGSNECGRDSINVSPHPIPGAGRCKIHVSAPALTPPIQFHPEQVFA